MGDGCSLKNSELVESRKMVEMTKNKYVDTKGERAEWEGSGDWD